MDTSKVFDDLKLAATHAGARRCEFGASSKSDSVYLTILVDIGDDMDRKAVVRISNHSNGACRGNACDADAYWDIHHNMDIDWVREDMIRWINSGAAANSEI